jgi:hypothetical protein
VTEQMSWLDAARDWQRCPPNVDTPRARRSDPETSHEAAARVAPKLRAQQQTVLDALARYPGSTAVELASKAGLDRYLVSRRLPELVPTHAKRGRPRACTVAGTAQTTWYPR